MVCLSGFLFYNWGNTLSSIIALSRSILAFFSGYDPYSVTGKNAFFRRMGQSLGLAVYFMMVFIVMKAVLTRTMALSGGAQKKTISQARFNRLKARYLSREALTLEQIETLQTQRRQDRKLIAELRDTVITTKLELESLQIGKSAKRKTPSVSPPSNDLFAPEAKKQHRSTPKRYVPKLLRRSPPKF